MKLLERIWDIIWKVVTWLPLTLWDVITDTLQEDDGKWSYKRLGGFSAFYFAVIYGFIPVWFPKFPIHEFIFWGFITFGATALGFTVWNKKIDKANLSDNEN